MDSLALVLLIVLGAIILYFWHHHYQREEDVAKKAIQASKMLATQLIIAPKSGNGFTKEPSEIQLVNDHLSILYTRAKRSDGKTVETAHIRINQNSFLTVTVVNHYVSVIGGNYTNTHDPDLPFQAKYAIAKIFDAIHKAVKDNVSAG